MGRLSWISRCNCKDSYNERGKQKRGTVRGIRFDWSLLILNMEGGHKPKSAEASIGRKNQENEFLPRSVRRDFGP